MRYLRIRREPVACPLPTSKDSPTSITLSPPGPPLRHRIPGLRSQAGETNDGAPSEARREAVGPQDRLGERAHPGPRRPGVRPSRPLLRGLDSLAYGKRELFEYWGHAAYLLPISMYPLVRYRMRTDQAREYMRSKRGFTARVYAEVCERGPIAAAELSEPGKRSGNWWDWAPGKGTLPIRRRTRCHRRTPWFRAAV